MLKINFFIVRLTLKQINIQRMFYSFFLYEGSNLAQNPYFFNFQMHFPGFKLRPILPKIKVNLNLILIGEEKNQ
jgi:hypothetical protein